MSTKPTDHDLQMLDAHLDDALSAIDAEHLRLRLAAEPELTAALERLREERAVRLAVWNAMEPDERAAETLANLAISHARRGERQRRVGRVLVAMTAAAACFVAGWVGRAAVTPEPVKNAVSSALSKPARPPSGDNGFQVALTDADGNVLATQKFTRLEDAQGFAADLALWQARQQQIRQGQVRLVADSF